MGKEYQVRNGVLVDKTPRVAAIVGRNVGELVHSIVPLVDANLHLLDGTELQDDGIYADGIAKIKALQASYPGLFTTEADWQSSVTTYGVCGKFVIGTGTLRLPKLAKSFIEATIDATALGDLVEAGLPEIEGALTGRGSPTSGVYGAITNGYGAFSIAEKVVSQGLGGVGGTTAVNSDKATFKASDSNAIYGNSTTVQPQSIRGFIYIVLGTFPKSSAVVNLDSIATDLNGKADVDITNLSNAGKEALAHAAMPSSRKEELTLPAANNSVIAPDDGYLTITSLSSAANGLVAFSRGGTSSVERNEAISTAAVNNSGVACTIAVRKGETVYVFYSNVASGKTHLYFTYCNGNAHLAS